MEIAISEDESKLSENPLHPGNSNQDAAVGASAAVDEEQVPLLAKRVIQLEQEVARVATRTELQGFFARLFEAPQNWHQATVYVVTRFSPGEGPPEMPSAAVMVQLGWMQVLCQWIAAVGICAGTAISSCSDNDTCGQAGMFCKAGICQYCGNDGPFRSHIWGDSNHPEFTTSAANMTAVVGLCTHPTAPELLYYASCGDHNTEDEDESWWECGKLWSTENVLNWCDACVHLPTNRVDSLSVDRLGKISVSSMRFLDWIALITSAVIVSLTVVAEVKDISLCEIAFRISCADGGRPSQGWVVALSALNVVRRYFFIPALLSAVPALVLLKGGDALSVVRRSLAVDFRSTILLAFPFCLSVHQRRAQSPLKCEPLLWCSASTLWQSSSCFRSMT